MTLAEIETHGRMADATTLTMQRLLPGPIERAWDWLTRSELRGKWLASGEMTLTPGSAFTLTWRNDTLTSPPGQRPEGMSEVNSADCTLLEATPPTHLKFDWTGMGEVSFDLKAVGEKVLLTLTHTGLVGRSRVLGVSAGWHAHLDVMQARLEGSTPKPHWDNWRSLRDTYAARLPE